MIKQINSTTRIRTAPLNWIVETGKMKRKRWTTTEKAHFNKFNQAKRYLLNQYPSKEVKHTIFKKLTELLKDLSIESTEELSAWHLTRIKKHPEFTHKLKPNSLLNLRNMPN